MDFPQLLKELNVSRGHMILHASTFLTFHLISFYLSLHLPTPQMLMSLGFPIFGLFALYSSHQRLAIPMSVVITN